MGYLNPIEAGAPAGAPRPSSGIVGESLNVGAWTAVEEARPTLMGHAPPVDPTTAEARRNIHSLNDEPTFAETTVGPPGQQTAEQISIRDQVAEMTPFGKTRMKPTADGGTEASFASHYDPGQPAVEGKPALERIAKAEFAKMMQEHPDVAHEMVNAQIATAQGLVDIEHAPALGHPDPHARIATGSTTVALTPEATKRIADTIQRITDVAAQAGPEAAPALERIKAFYERAMAPGASGGADAAAPDAARGTAPSDAPEQPDRPKVVGTDGSSPGNPSEPDPTRGPQAVVRLTKKTPTSGMIGLGVKPEAKVRNGVIGPEGEVRMFEAQKPFGGLPLEGQTGHDAVHGLTVAPVHPRELPRVPGAGAPSNAIFSEAMQTGLTNALEDRVPPLSPDASASEAALKRFHKDIQGINNQPANSSADVKLDAGPTGVQRRSIAQMEEMAAFGKLSRETNTGRSGDIESVVFKSSGALEAFAKDEFDKMLTANPKVAHELMNAQLHTAEALMTIAADPTDLVAHGNATIALSPTATKTITDTIQHIAKQAEQLGPDAKPALDKIVAFYQRMMAP